MANQRIDLSNSRIPVAGVMCLIALAAVILKWPVLVLAALPIIVCLGSRALCNASTSGAAALGLISLTLSVAVCVLWARSYDLSDGLFCRFSGGYALIRSSRGHVVVAVGSYPGMFVRAGTNWLQYERSDATDPLSGKLPNTHPNVILGTDRGDRFAGGSLGGFGWSEKRNPRLGTLLLGGVTPFWYLLATTAASPLWWLVKLRRCGGLVRGIRLRPPAMEAA